MQLGTSYLLIAGKKMGKSFVKIATLLFKPLAMFALAVASSLMTSVPNLFADWKEVPPVEGVCVENICADGSRIPCSAKCPTFSFTSEPRSNLTDLMQDVDLSNRTYSAVTNNLAAFSSVVETLDEQLRLLLNQLSPYEQGSLQDALNAVVTRWKDAVAKNRGLQARVYALEEKVAALRDQLLKMQARKEALLSKVFETEQSIDSLNVQIAEYKHLLQSATTDLEQARRFARESSQRAQMARKRYWALHGNLFDRKFGLKPRDFTPKIRHDPVTTLRRTIYEDRTLRPSTPIRPFAAVPNNIAISTSLPVLKTAIAPKRVPTKDQLVQALNDWGNALNETGKLQKQLKKLVDVTDRSIDQIQKHAQDVQQVERQLSATEALYLKAKKDAASSLIMLQDAVSLRKEQIDAGWRANKESAFWEFASRSLEAALYKMSEPALVARHVTWVLSTYSQLLTKDLPTVIELLGPNPSPEALERYEYLLNLNENYTREFAMAWSLGASKSKDTNIARMEQFSQRELEVEYKMRDRIIKLGTDPATGGYQKMKTTSYGFRLEQGLVGVKIEKVWNIEIEPDQERITDWIVKSTTGEVGWIKAGMRIELVGSGPKEFFEMKKFINEIRNHLKEKLADVFVINMAHAPRTVSLNKVRAEVLKMPEATGKTIKYIDSYSFGNFWDSR